MGKARRERIERILNGEEQSIAAQKMSLSGFNQKVVSKVESVTRKILEKAVVPKWMKMELPQQVAIARKMLKTAGLINFRSTFLKDSNFPSDLVDKYKSGWTSEQIRSFFWDCEEWVSFWTDLELNKEHFEELLIKAEQKV